MGFRLVIFLLSFLPIVAYSQVAEMKDGKVYKGDKVYCFYKETGKRISTLEIPTNVSNPLSFPEASNDEFRDYEFGGEYQPYITAKAKLLASAKEAFMVYYYSISFQGLDRVLNVRYHPLLIRTLAQDIAKYDVVQNGFFNEKNAQKLVDKWAMKTTLLDKDVLQQGVASDYNSATGKAKQQPSTINIKVEGDKIYRDNNLFAVYTLDKHLTGGGVWGSSKGSNLYKIDDPNGNLLAWVSVPVLRSTFFLLPAGEKESLSVVTTDRDEQKIIANAAKVLIVHSAAKDVVK